MTLAILDDDMRDALEPWDGKTWFIQEPSDHVKGLYSFTQIQAHDILRRGRGLTNWEAEHCQRAFFNWRGIDGLARAHLDRIEREKCGRNLAW